MEFEDMFSVWRYLLAEIINLSPGTIAIYNFFRYLISPAGLLFLSFLLILAFITLKLLKIPNWLYSLIKYYKKEFVILEIKTKSNAQIPLHETTSFIDQIFEICNEKNVFKAIFTKHNIASFEIYYSELTGLRYLIRIEKEKEKQVKDLIKVYLKNSHINLGSDPIKSFDENKTVYKTYKLNKHFAFPLKETTLDSEDPVEYISAAIRSCNADTKLGIQLIASPIDRKLKRRIKAILNATYSTKSCIYDSVKKRPFQFFFLVLYYFSYSSFLIIIYILLHLTTDFNMWNPIRKKSAQDPKDQGEIKRKVRNKINKNLFNVSMKVIASSSNEQTLKSTINALENSFYSFRDNEENQYIKVSKYSYLPNPDLKLLSKRLPLYDRSCVMSSLEIASIFHFPSTKQIKPEDLPTDKIFQIPIPIELKMRSKEQKSFANNIYHGKYTDVSLTKKERLRHTYILGATGTGKSTLIFNMILNDIYTGNGVCVIDPHGDLIERILLNIPQDRIKDCIYFNPIDIESPMSINLLECDRTNPLEREYVTEGIISLLKKSFGEKNSGPRLEYILRYAIYTALYDKNATFDTVYKLITDSRYRNRFLKDIDDKNLLAFWKTEFNMAGQYQKTNMVSPITNKIGRYIQSVITAPVLTNPKSTIDFDEILENKKILLCNLSKGKIGEENSSLLGTTILTKLQLSLMKRADKLEDERADYYVYVDEFQNFATESFASLFSEARKYRLGVTLAHQSTSQIQNHSLFNTILSSVGTIISFRTSSPYDESRIIENFNPYVNKGDLLNLPAYVFFIKIAAVTPFDAFTAETILIKDSKNSYKKEITEHSKKAYTYKISSNEKLEDLKEPKFKEIQKTKEKKQEKEKTKSRAKKKRAKLPV